MSLTSEQVEWQQRIDSAFVRLGLPIYMYDGVVQFVLHGTLPGGFLTAVLEDRFLEAAGRADEENQAVFWSWASLLYNDVPCVCRGSPARVNAWVARRGLDNITPAPAEGSTP